MPYGLKIQGNANGDNFTIADSSLDLINYRVTQHDRASYVTLDYPLGDFDFIFVKSPTAVGGGNYTSQNVDNIYGDVTVYSPEIFFLESSFSDALENIIRFKGRGFAPGGYQNNTYVTADWNVDLDYFVVRHVDGILDNASNLNNDEYGLQIKTSSGAIGFDSRALTSNEVFHIEEYLPPSDDWTVFGDPIIYHSNGAYVNLEWSLTSNSSNFEGNPSTDLFGLSLGTNASYYYDSVLRNYGRTGSEIYSNFRNLNALFAARLEASSSGSGQQDESSSGSLQFSNVTSLTEGTGQSISFQATTDESGPYHVKLFRVSGSDGVALRDFVSSSSTFTGTNHTATFSSYNTTTSYNITKDNTILYTRQSVVDAAQSFNRDFIGNFIVYYTGDFTGNFTRTSIYNRNRTGYISYVGNYTRTSAYEGNYNSESVRNITRTTTSNVSYTAGLSFEGNYSRFYARTIYYNWNILNPSEEEGRFELVLRPQTYTETYERDRASTFTEIYTRNRPTTLSTSKTFTSTSTRNRAPDTATSKTFAGTYTRNRSVYIPTDKTYSRTSIRTRYSTYNRDSTRTRITSYQRFRPGIFSRTVYFLGNFLGNFTGDFVPQVDYARTSSRVTSTRISAYSQNFARTRYSSYEGTYTKTRQSAYSRSRAVSSTRYFIGNKGVTFTGNYNRTIYYIGNTARTRITYYADMVDFTRIRTSAYEGNYARAFVGNYNRTFVGNYTKASNFFRTFVGNFTGGNSYEGNYNRTRTSAYERTRTVSGSDPWEHSIQNGVVQYAWRIVTNFNFGDNDPFNPGGGGSNTYSIELRWNGVLVHTSDYDTYNEAIAEDGPIAANGKYYWRGVQVGSATAFHTDYKIAETTTLSAPSSTQTFIGNYSRDFTGNYDRIRTVGTSSTRDRSSAYAGTITYIGNRVSTYLGNYSRNYAGNYTRNFIGNDTRISVREVNEQGTIFYEPVYYSRSFMGTNTRTRTKQSGRIVYRYSTYTKSRASTYTVGFEGNFNRDFIGEYTGVYSRSFIGNYTGDFDRTLYFIGDFTGNFIGPKRSQIIMEGYVVTYPVNYTRTSNRTSTRTRPQVFDYAGTYTGDYTGNFLGNFIGNYAGDFIGNFLGEYTGTYSRTVTYLGNYEGNYTGTYSRTLSYIGNYLGNFTGTYSRSSSYLGNYQGNYVGNVVDSYSRYPISYYTRISARDNVRVSVFTRILEFIGNYTGNYEGAYTRDFTDISSYIRTPSYLGDYANFVPSTRNSTVTSTRDFTKTRVSSYSDGAKTYYTGEFVGNYTSTSTVTTGDSELGWQGEVFLAQLRSGNDTSSVNAQLGSEGVEVLAEKEFTLYDNDSGIFTTTTNRIVHPDATNHELSITHLTEGTDTNAVQMRVYRGSLIILSDVSITTNLNTFTVNEVPPNGSSYTYNIQVFNGSNWIAAGSYTVTKPNQVDPTSTDDNTEPPPEQTDTSSAGSWWRDVTTYTQEMEEIVTNQINWQGTNVYNTEINQGDYVTQSYTTGGYTYIKGDYISSDYGTNYQIDYYTVTRT
jgi:hypothetical protein